MMNFIKTRTSSLSMVVLVLILILLLQGSISYSMTFGRLDQYIPGLRYGVLPSTWLGLRIALLTCVVVLWVMDRKRWLFRTIIFVNSIFTLGLILNLAALGDVLLGISTEAIKALLVGVVFMAISNILIFSIWYWLIDPPGVEENPREDEPWDFLFPQRASPIPHYEDWIPRFTDYLSLAFTTSFAFSPTDTLPLTRRAKILMMLQATISLITITGIAGSAIGILVGSG